MQINTKHLLTMLVVAGISAAALPANAASFAAGDLLLGFQASGGTGAGTDLIVDLGPATTLRDATSNIADLANIGSILSTTYGSDWATRSDLSWGAVANAQAAGFGSGINGDPKATNYMTIAQSTTSLGAQMSTAPTVAGHTSQSAISSDIQSLNATATNNSLTQGGYITIPSSTGTTWTSQIADSNFKLGTPIQANSASGIASTGLDLYRILDTTTGANPSGTPYVGSWLGTIGVDSTGTVSFSNTVAAAPEPSRALLAALGLGGLLLRRRRQLNA